MQPDRAAPQDPLPGRLRELPQGTLALLRQVKAACRTSAALVASSWAALLADSRTPRPGPPGSRA
jgi:hypothetical protein